MRLLFTLLGCVLLTTLSLTSQAQCDPGIISGPTTVCGGASITLASTVSGGVWTASGAATVDPAGVVTGSTIGGTSTITYTVTDLSGTCMTSQVVTVNATAATISGPTTVCAGNAVILTTTGTGGTWSSNFPSTASVTSGGVVIGHVPGSVTISYTMVNICGTVTATSPMTVGAPAAGPIFGPSSVCQGSTITLTAAVPGGTWTSQVPGIASVNASTGVVTGVVASGTVISYSATNACGTAVATVNVLVNPLPFPGSISGPTHVCAGTTITLTETVSGGTWSSSNSAGAPIVPLGLGTSAMVTGIFASTTNITYTVVNSCGPSFATMTVTVDPAAIAGPISGPAGMCYPGTVTLAGAMTGGTWSTAPTWIATVTPTTGVVTSVSHGSVVVFYTVNNSCGSSTAVHTILIDTLISAGTIGGATNICMGTTATLTETVAGGTWYIGTTGVATINSSGVVTAISPGTATVLYSVANGCGGAVATKIITVLPAADAGTLSGTARVCTGSTTALASTVGGGTWSSSTPTVGTVSAGGAVYGINVGTTTITYKTTGTCGTAQATYIVTVEVSPVAGPIIGPTKVCAGDSIHLAAASLSGAWNISITDSNIARMSVVATGFVVGWGPGSVVVTFTTSNSCGIATANYNVEVINCKLEVNEMADAGQIHIFPNPAQNSINITSDETIREVVITDMVGQKVFSSVVNAKATTVDMENFASGVYIIKINDSQAYRIVKE